MSSVFNKFNCLSQDLGQKIHNLNSDTLKVMLTNVTPLATNAVLGDLTEISAGNGYSAGGSAAASNAYTQTSGVGKLTASDVVFTATGSIGPFQYAVLYNSTASGKNLIGWFDYGTGITLASTDTFTVHWDSSGGILTIT